MIAEQNYNFSKNAQNKSGKILLQIAENKSLIQKLLNGHSHNTSSNWLTLPLIHGTKIPIVKMPSNGPFVIASKLIVSCSTVPIFCTTTTKATQITPTQTTTERIIQLTAKFERGRLTNGLKKSSKTTADMEFRHVDSELRAALNTPAIKRPDRPGISPRVSITNSGSSWSFARASCL